MLTYLPLLLALALGGSIVLIFMGLASPRTVYPVQARLDQFAARQVLTLEEIELTEPFSKRVIKPLIQGIAGFIGRLAPRHNVENLRHRLDLAGNPYNWGPAEFLGVRGLSALVCGALPLGLLLLARAPLPNLVFFTALLGVLGYYLPLIWLGRKVKRRQGEILKALPDTLDLLTITVEAGLGFDAAMNLVTEKWDNELSWAFARTIAEIRMGKGRKVALRDMADRAEVSELTSFVAAIIQADQLGVSIARVLRIQSEQMRIRRRQRAEELAHQAPIKMMIPLTFLIFPAIFVILLGPAIPKLRDVFVTGGIY
ncbi:MAG: type II secretion system F family protein [Anaerolineae bacterium]|nr:type II secretion system F family protein [Anaerolineae bacterium]